jgi:hypothetical protein
MSQNFNETKKIVASYLNDEIQREFTSYPLNEIQNMLRVKKEMKSSKSVRVKV